MRNIVLIGMRGAGKTLIGKALAQNLKLKFIDTDSMITATANATIPEIVDQFGWPYFRELEKQEVVKASELEGCVISTGGGVILDPENMKHLNKGTIVYLEAHPAILESRVKDSERPDLSNHMTFKDIFKERQSLYEKYSDIRFDVSQESDNKEYDCQVKANQLSELILSLSK